MARKSRAAIEAETLAKAEEISSRAKAEAMEMFTSFTAKFMEQIAGARSAVSVEGAAPSAANPNADRTLAENLAHAMLQATGTPAKRAAMLTPEEKADRESAWNEMVGVLTELHARAVVPIYRVTQETFLGETMIYRQWQDPVTKQMRDQELNWPGIPNQAMVPMPVAGREADRVQLEAGQKVYELYLRWIGHDPGVNRNAPLPFVVDGKAILRGNATAPAPVAAASAPGFDPRRLGTATGVQSIPILGTVAAPAVVTP